MSKSLSNIDKQAGEGDVSPKTYYIHPMAFGSTKNPGYGHVPVVHADDFEMLRAKLEGAEKRIAELEAREVRISRPKIGRLHGSLLHLWSAYDVQIAVEHAGIKFKVGE